MEEGRRKRGTERERRENERERGGERIKKMERERGKSGGKEEKDMKNGLQR